MYLLGEALIGEEPEIAHIDLVIGDKNGPVGMAFANAMSHMSAGHTPLLAVIRPNLPTKPSTLIVPKVTVENLEQAAQVFGPAQTAVAKAVADAAEEGLIPKDKAEDIVLIVSVFIHPEAEDYSKIYRYNYGATKLAIQRAMENFPSVDKVIYEKDRSTHPIMGFKITRLWDPPYLQVALDIPSMESAKKVLEELPESDHLILEAGTPLIKRYGLDIVKKMRETRPDAFIVADLKTLDVGHLETRLAADVTADAVVISGLAPLVTIEKAIKEARKTGIYSIIDMLNVGDPKGVLEQLSVMPDVVELHRAIDVEPKEMKHAWGDIKGIKALSDKMLVAVAGGIRAENAQEAIKAGADIIIVGRAITKAKDIEGMARRFLKLMKEEIDQFRVMTDF
ncbi:MAG: bifunctional 5,6,7,8-tetrahydromethanopterin hydro-lyase/3-hexulose-6-phosphate synthase [Methanocellales archaeon]|nr:bifunctional 5,6,7,8-tetrahydromethanopterin hydro-lyase/3-hexulose-6-phosphate synthase [Methanocellales archaeon]MDI6903561.1 bifunctional 5,6,7,8-tetrahydromethanopterin hydro-lyase/3-hexulose-6-phosphate synthase [Methanocellales archaeon]